MSHGGKAAHDALQRLAISVDPPRAFVDRDVRAANLRRLRDDAVGECLRIFQLCAAPALGEEGNLRLVLTPCVRWCVCARLLRAVGRRVDEAVRRDVAAAVEAVAAAAAARERVERDEDDQRSDGFAHANGRHRSPLAAIERRTRTASRPRRGDRSTTGASRALVEDAERVVTALADQMLGGWKGAPAGGGDSPGGDPTDDDDDAEREWRDVANDAARDFADAVAHPLASALLSSRDDAGDDRVTECVDGLLTPAAVAVANAAARVAAGADDVAREGRSCWTAFEPPAACATAAADCCDRVRAAAEQAFKTRSRREKEKEKEEEGYFGFGIAAFTGSAGAGGDDGGRAGGVFGTFSGRGFESEGERDGDERDFSGAGAALRRTCETGKVAEELATAARTAHAAVAAVSAARDERRRTGRSGVRTPRGATTTANSEEEEEEEEEEGIRAARADARRALRSCDSAARCSRALADATRGVAAALYLPLTVATNAKRGGLWKRRVGSSFAVIHGSQAARDFAREGDGIALAAGAAGAFARIPTGPFLAHFVAACGAVEAALRSQQTLDVNDEDDDEGEDPVEGARAPRGTRISRWMSPTSQRSHQRRGTLEETIGANEGEKRRGRLEEEASEEGDAHARAAARVVLSACRTVRGGDALDYVHDLFPPALGFVVGVAQPSETAWFYDEGTFAPVEVRVTRRRVVVTARDGFVVSREVPEGVPEGYRMSDGGVGVPTDLRAWCVVCVVSEQTLEPRRDTDLLGGGRRPGGSDRSRLARLEPGSTSIRLDPRASRERMDARLRALRSGNRT